MFMCPIKYLYIMMSFCKWMEMEMNARICTRKRRELSVNCACVSNPDKARHCTDNNPVTGGDIDIRNVQ
jgi:hypothetical protein